MAKTLKHSVLLIIAKNIIVIINNSRLKVSLRSEKPLYFVWHGEKQFWSRFVFLENISFLQNPISSPSKLINKPEYTIKK